MRHALRLSLLIATACATSNDGSLAITGVTLIDGTGAPPRANTTVIIRDRRIAEIRDSNASPRGARVIDGRGKYLMPGLFDMHTHLSFWGDDVLPTLLRYGVLFVRDLGGSLEELDKWRGEIEGGARKGPHIYRAGPYVDGPKKMEGKRAETTIVVKTPEEARATVAMLHKRGVDTIKTHNTIPREAFLAVADECKRENLPLAVHPATKNMRLEEVSDAGVTTLEHIEMLTENIVFASAGPDGKLTKDPLMALDELTDERVADLFARFKRNGTTYDPTLVAYRTFMQEAVDLAPKDSKWVRAAAGRTKMFNRFVQIVGLMHRAGMQVITGTDCGKRPESVPYPVPSPGLDLHEEMKLFVQGGFTPMEAIQAATSIPARVLRIDARAGTIEEGKDADMVLLDRDPLADITNTRAIEGVVFRGAWVSVALPVAEWVSAKEIPHELSGVDAPARLTDEPQR